MANSTTRIVQIPSELSPVAVLGAADSNLRELEKAFPSIDISVHADCVKIVSRSARSEEDACKAEHALRKIVDCAYEAPVDSYAVKRMLERDVLKGSEHNVRIDRIGHNGGVLGGAFSGLKSFGNGTESGFGTGAMESDFARGSADLMPSSEDAKRRAMSRKARMAKGVITFAGGNPVRAKTAGQTAYIQAMESNTVTFGIGPAGTGKTYLAVAKAVRALEDGRVRRIVLTRPAVEAGENLGFLPGTLNDKVDPYLRPLYDALSDMLGAPQLKRYMDENVVEVAPLAYMRGRTLNDAFVILDEAQNATVQQLKMFLTRLGFNTTMVITGDRTQVDLAVPKSGLASIENVLKDVKSIAFVHLNAQDVVRAELVGRIVEAYEAWENREADFRREKARNRKSLESQAANESQNLERNIK
ncbi:PhoH family protein [Gardnerella vaginalis]|uniref:PhoH-like protein n=1 Tax=Gardnerella vaginalis (strain ATCC 14019 / 317) TaxID=525284 RepID=E3DAE8_GARV3|nr:PhoH family protein [Gardnerella vaginalis]ADP39042.1 PhoH family protein [Gardnerella vaginalis ATCC 14019]KOS08781.1 phosphate starvation-inducible protein PhoH [Gardnerella vaginalis]TCH81072.1 PhoH family protein [Gardnerella vaginalis]TCH82315.1 PhoH family protein [Gardnerella vaginalis ATCC 14018 = JCM 11026]SDR70938.1 phosphate starvation-inducible protein PhoH [Gardnerella vaginalis]